MASSPAAEPYNVWADEHPDSKPRHQEDEKDLDKEELSRIEEAIKNSGMTEQSSGGSPGKYSAYTIRQKKGRQLVSTMKTGSGSSSSSSGGDTTMSSSASSLFDPPAGQHYGEKDQEKDLEKGYEETIHLTNNNNNNNDSSITTTKATRLVTGDGLGGKLARKVSAFPSVGLYQGLGRWQAISAMAFGVFGVIHLVPPVLATVGGVDLANQALMWGRAYYQTYGIEEVLVYGSFMVHIGTGLCKALIRLIWKAKSHYAARKPVTDGSGNASSNTTTTTTTNIIASGTSSTLSSSVASASSDGKSGGGASASAPGLFPFHRLAGWILTPLVLGHSSAMRAVPVQYFGDSAMVDYWFVTYLYRIRQPVLPYVLLVGLMTYHMFGGGPVAFNRVLPQGSASRIKVQELIKTKRTRAMVAGVVSTVALAGVYRIITAEGIIPMAKLYRMIS